MMKLLIDQGLPRSAAARLREVGCDAVHVGEVGAATATDEDILRMGREQDRAVVTLDADFHSLLALSGAVSPSVIRIRIEGLDGPALAGLLELVVRSCRADIEQGAVVTVQERRVRVRLLPILR